MKHVKKTQVKKRKTKKQSTKRKQHLKQKKPKTTRKHRKKSRVSKKRRGAGLRTVLAANVKNIGNIGKRVFASNEYSKDVISLEEIREQILKLEEDLSAKVNTKEGISIVLNAYKKKVESCPTFAWSQKDPNETWKLLDCHTTKTVFYYRCMQYLSSIYKSIGILETDDKDLDPASVKDKKRIKSNMYAMAYHFESRQKSHGRSAATYHYLIRSKPDYMRKHNQYTRPAPLTMRIAKPSDDESPSLIPVERIVPNKDADGNNTGQWIVFRTNMIIDVLNGTGSEYRSFQADPTSTNKLSRMVEYLYEHSWRGPRPVFNTTNAASEYLPTLTGLYDRYGRLRDVNTLSQEEEEVFTDMLVRDRTEVRLQNEKEDYIPEPDVGVEAVPLTSRLKREYDKSIESYFDENINYLKSQSVLLSDLMQQFTVKHANVKVMHNENPQKAEDLFKNTVLPLKSEIETVAKDLNRKGFPVVLFRKVDVGIDNRGFRQYKNMPQDTKGQINKYIEKLEQGLKTYNRDAGATMVPVETEAEYAPTATAVYLDTGLGRETDGPMRPSVVDATDTLVVEKDNNINTRDMMDSMKSLS